MIFRTQDRPQMARARSVQPWDGAGKELALDLCYYSLAAGASDHPRLGPLGIACESCSGAGTGGHLEARGARLQSTVPYGRPNGRVENKKEEGRLVISSVSGAVLREEMQQSQNGIYQLEQLTGKTEERSDP